MNRSRHVRGFLALLLACLWIAAASWAEHISAEFPLCQPAQSPCCPQPASNTSESCPACHISVTIAAKDIREQERLKSLPKARIALSHQPKPPATSSRRELTAGLCNRTTVFDLKDDLRV